MSVARKPLTNNFLAYEKGQRAVRRGEWKLIRYPLVNYTMLFNLKDDPDELHNLAEDAKYADKVSEMMTRLAARQKFFDDPHPHTSKTPGAAKIDITFFEK